jgi:hypothetical protein
LGQHQPDLVITQEVCEVCEVSFANVRGRPRGYLTTRLASSRSLVSRAGFGETSIEQKEELSGSRLVLMDAVRTSCEHGETRR